MINLRKTPVFELTAGTLAFKIIELIDAVIAGLVSAIHAVKTWATLKVFRAFRSICAHPDDLVIGRRRRRMRLHSAGMAGTIPAMTKRERLFLGAALSRFTRSSTCQSTTLGQ